MNQFEAYSLLFTDSLVSNLVISINRELIIDSMKIFGTYNNLLICIVATIASIIANSINYFFGRILLNIFYFPENEQAVYALKQLVHLYLKYSVIILSLVIVPFWGRFIPLSAGFIKMNFIKVLTISALMKLCYYIYILM